MLLRIYDRWGELVFEKKNFGTNNEYEGWDGTYKGNEISPGVYVFYAEIELLDGTRRTITGDITLVKIQSYYGEFDPGSG
jgi:gliding motility-associated-like protein